jgi:hypothetical protein
VEQGGTASRSEVAQGNPRADLFQAPPSRSSSFSFSRPPRRFAVGSNACCSTTGWRVDSSPHTVTGSQVERELDLGAGSLLELFDEAQLAQLSATEFRGSD